MRGGQRWPAPAPGGADRPEPSLAQRARRSCSPSGRRISVPAPDSDLGCDRDVLGALARIASHCVGLDSDAIGLLAAAPKSRPLSLPASAAAEPIDRTIGLGWRAEDRGARAALVEVGQQADEDLKLGGARQVGVGAAEGEQGLPPPFEGRPGSAREHDEEVREDRIARLPVAVGGPAAGVDGPPVQAAIATELRRQIVRGTVGAIKLEAPIVKA